MANNSIMLNATERWRLLLGEASHPSFSQGLGRSGSGNDGNDNLEQVLAMDKALSWLYGRDTDDNIQESFDRHSGGKQGGSGGSVLSTPDWVNEIQTLFPKETIERLEKDALEHYHLDDLVTSAEALERATPNPTLLSAVLKTKHLMNPEVLAMARKLVAQVVKDLMEKLEPEVIRCFSGKKNSIAYKKTGSYSQFAVKETLKRNLKNYQPESKKLLVKQPWFYLTEKNNPKKWQIILVIDQSGSMANSVIHSAVMAGCFWQLPNMKTHLLVFDTQVVDLTEDVDDPTEILMQVQLGGGTDIAHAMDYASQLISDCQRSIVVLVSDFYEGGSEHQLISIVESLTTQGTKVLGLGALDEQANPDYCEKTAEKLMKAGAEIGIMTPAKLAQWISEVIG